MTARIRHATVTERGVYVITDATWPKGVQFSREAAEFRTWCRQSMGVAVDRNPFVKLGNTA